MKQARKDPLYLTDTVLSAHLQGMGRWRCLGLDQGDLNMLIAAAMCGVLLSIYEVNRVTKCC